MDLQSVGMIRPEGIDEPEANPPGQSPLGSNLPPPPEEAALRLSLQINKIDEGKSVA